MLLAKIYHEKKRIIDIGVAIGAILCVVILCFETELKWVLVFYGIAIGSQISRILDIIIDYRKEKNMDNSN